MAAAIVSGGRADPRMARGLAGARKHILPPHPVMRPLPLALLDQRMDAWIAAEKAK